MRKFFKTTNCILLVIALIGALLIIAATCFGIKNYVVISGSMVPNVPKGCIAIVNGNAKFEDVKLGDVIIFKSGNSFIIHRVVDEDIINGKKRLKTKGDANKIDDGFSTTEENFYGIALFYVPKLGYLSNFQDIL